nr:MAG TPA: hypothetical protein [Caudoviricetes sp.]
MTGCNNYRPREGLVEHAKPLFAQRLCGRILNKKGHLKPNSRVRNCRPGRISALANKK